MDTQPKPKENGWTSFNHVFSRQGSNPDRCLICDKSRSIHVYLPEDD